MCVSGEVSVDHLSLHSDDDNRIVLQPINGRSDCQNDYINASYVEVGVSSNVNAHSKL